MIVIAEDNIRQAAIVVQGHIVLVVTLWAIITVRGRAVVSGRGAVPVTDR